MIYKRRYLQFNDLVLDSYKMLRESPHNAEFKGETIEYSFGHGSYDPYKRNYLFVREQEVSVSITLYMLKLPCEYREFYKRFAIEQVTKPGKLWAIVNNQIVWAYARATSMSESEDAERDEYRIELDLILPEGIWHKADKLKTFLIPYDPCDFMDCLGYKDVNPCEDIKLDGGDCCEDCLSKQGLAEHSCCDDLSCCCDSLEKGMALCFHDDLQDFYKECMPSYQIVYNCKKGNEFFADKYLGEKICTKDICSNIIAGRFYSDTELPTKGYEIVLDGESHDPQIEINGVKNVIKGNYDRLFIHSNGEVYSESKNRCCKTLLDPEVWVMPKLTDEYGWTIYPKQNRIVVDRGSCCGRACVYIQTDNITI